MVILAALAVVLYMSFTEVAKDEAKLAVSSGVDYAALQKDMEYL